MEAILDGGRRDRALPELAQRPLRDEGAREQEVPVHQEPVREQPCSDLDLRQLGQAQALEGQPAAMDSLLGDQTTLRALSRECPVDQDQDGLEADAAPGPDLRRYSSASAWSISARSSRDALFTM